MSELTCCTETFQQQVQKLFIDVLTDVDLRSEQDCLRVGNRQVLAANGKREELLWYFSHLVWMQSSKKHLSYDFIVTAKKKCLQFSSFTFFYTILFFF